MTRTGRSALRKFCSAQARKTSPRSGNRPLTTPPAIVPCRAQQCAERAKEGRARGFGNERRSHVSRLWGWHKQHGKWRELLNRWSSTRASRFCSFFVTRDKGINLLLSLFLVPAVTLLKPADQLIALASDYVKIVIGKFSPL